MTTQKRRRVHFPFVACALVVLVEMFGRGRRFPRLQLASTPLTDAPAGAGLLTPVVVSVQSANRHSSPVDENLGFWQVEKEKQPRTY